MSSALVMSSYHTGTAIMHKNSHTKRCSILSQAGENNRERRRMALLRMLLGMRVLKSEGCSRLRRRGAIEYRLNEGGIAVQQRSPRTE
jgi:hypothetical protein